MAGKRCCMTIGRWLTPAFVLCLASFSLVAWADGTPYTIRETAAPCIVLRSLPQSGAERRDCLVPGTRVTEIDSKPYWRRVRLEDGRDGWVAEKFLEPAVPVLEVQPPLAAISNAWLEL